MSRYDLLIIGGGINGLGIAVDAALRGLRVLLVEKEDISSGTTSTSSRLIHGGLRYLQYGELSLVRESLRERGLLVRQRPHLIRPIQLLIPTFQNSKPPAWVIGIGLALYGILAIDPAFPAPHHLFPREVRSLEPDLTTDGLTGAFRYPDAQIEFPERLCVELMRECRAAGGEVRTHTRVTGLNVWENRVIGTTLQDVLTGAEEEVEAALTINAAGPWVDVVNRLLPEPPPRLIGGTWGTHLVLPLRTHGLRGPVYSAAKRDGRPFFLLPWDGRLLVGTTDVKFEGDPDRAHVEAWEVEYLLEETNRLLPRAEYGPEDVQFTTVGVRPLPASDRNAGAITRRHFLVDHAARHGVGGLGSVVGGKLTTYRSLAEEVVDWSFRTLGRAPAPCPTRQVREVSSLDALQSGAREMLRALKLPESGGSRLARLYGASYREVLELARTRPELTEPLTPTSAALRAEVVYARDVEGARTVEDVLLRRLMLLPPAPEAGRAVKELLAAGAAR